MNQFLFHLAFPVGNIPQTKEFYAQGLGCETGRESAQALILNLYGHQLVAHVTPEPIIPQQGIYPRHFGLVFTQRNDWDALLARAQQHQLPFYQPPRQRFPELPLEHHTFFLVDPFHNLLEFKFYRHPEAIFGLQEHTQIGDRPGLSSP
ncbi:glyoxalase [Neosynechococcus sphagnicola sy1]|uniref:Glyoxalase n=1 Tax=Neosynechococcus sphagnicola sy1 TaxID=1497020 RepID=A0A098TN58_9CYAN|nr:VOC family protein [Neosynechococcus sphagnicola]KGF73307.1 glyoxalase [Neosynechococcus sphagnicola sy1]